MQEEIKQRQSNGDKKYHSKKYYSCPTCSNIFFTKNLLHAHLQRVSGCQAAESLLDSFMIKQLEKIENLLLEYRANYDLLIPLGRKKKLIVINNKMILCKKSFENHQMSFTESRREMINKVLDEFVIDIEELKTSYIQSLKFEELDVK